MKIIFYSKCGHSLGIALRCKQEGSQVSMYYAEKDYEEVGKGYIDTCRNLTDIVSKKPDLVVFDTIGYSEDARTLNKYGIKTLFSDATADKLKAQHGLGAQLAKNVGIRVIECKEFESLDDVQKHVLGEPGPYILKPLDGYGPERVFVSDNDDEMVAYIDWLKEQSPASAGKKYTLRRIVKGVEVSTEVWFQNGKPIFPANIVLKTDRFLAGNLGPRTGCQTALLGNYSKKEPRLVQEHKKIWMLLEKINYTGPWGMKTIVDGRAVNFLKWTPRLEYSAIFALLELFTGDISKFLMDLGQGILKEMPVRHDLGYAVNVSVPPYPNHMAMSKIKGTPVLYDRNDEKHIWYQDMRLGRGGPVVAGTDALVMIATTSAATPHDCEVNMNNLLDKISIPNKQYRIDGIRAVQRGYDRLKLEGYF